MAQYEYEIIREYASCPISLTEKINRLSKKGWEIYLILPVENDESIMVFLRREIN